MTASEDFLPFGAPDIQQAEIDEVEATLRSGWLGTGPRVRRFEAEFRAYKQGWGHPVALNSCTAALHLAYLGCGMAPGDEVITTSMTFCATVNTIIHAGATPVLVDVDRTTMNIDPAAIEAAITPRTRCVAVVHMAGRSCEMDAIVELCRRHDLLLVEDCAHAIETQYHGQHAGTFGDFSCFSFYVTKNIAMGEGGLLLCRDEAAADRARVRSLHGMSRDAWKRYSSAGYSHYAVVEPGFKYNMMDIQAAIGLHQLARVEEGWLRRRAIWSRYQEALADTGLILPAEPDADTIHAYHLFPVLVDEERCGVSRDQFLEGMAARRIGVGVHYQSIAEHPVYQERFGWRAEQWPEAYFIGQRTASLSITPSLTPADQERVIAAVRSVLGLNR